MEVTGESISKRNKAINHALRNHLLLDPDNFLIDSVGMSNLPNLISTFFQSSINYTEVMKWTTFVSNLPDKKDAYFAALEGLNEDLAQKSVLLGGLASSVADVIVFSALHDFVSHFSSEEVLKYPNVIRWIDYVQNKEDFGGAFDLIAVNKLPFEHFTSIDDKALVDTIKVNKVAEAKVAAEPTKVVKVAEDKASTEQIKRSSEEKKKPFEKESSEKDSECSITILKVQVGIVIKAWKHPSADSLLVEEIDLGDGNLRQVVSGLAIYYNPDDLINRRVVLITNVKPGKLRDVMSSGLVLCASNREHTVVEPLIPPEGAKIGEQVLFSGFEGKPEDALNPKKKQLEKITPHLYTDGNGVATYKGIPFMTSAGPCMSSIFNATIK